MVLATRPKSVTNEVLIFAVVRTVLILNGTLVECD
jgi:hypothetical protein